MRFSLSALALAAVIATPTSALAQTSSAHGDQSSEEPVLLAPQVEDADLVVRVRVAASARRAALGRTARRPQRRFVVTVSNRGRAEATDVRVCARAPKVASRCWTIARLGGDESRSRTITMRATRITAEIVDERDA